MASTKGVTEVLVKLSDGTSYTITDTTGGLQAVFLDPAAAIAAGIPLGTAPTTGVTVTKKATVKASGGTSTMMATTTDTTDTTICYYVNGQLYCPPAK